MPRLCPSYYAPSTCSQCGSTFNTKHRGRGKHASKAWPLDLCRSCAMERNKKLTYEHLIREREATGTARKFGAVDRGMIDLTDAQIEARFQRAKAINRRTMHVGDPWRNTAIGDYASACGQRTDPD